jgi:hypothetical protein
MVKLIIDFGTERLISFLILYRTPSYTTLPMQHLHIYYGYYIEHCYLIRNFYTKNARINI